VKVLILGGYGTFGGRLAELLANEQRLTLIIAGRDGAKAQAFCDAQAGPARMVPAVVDRGNPEAAIAGLKPDLVVDASGPFQAYGDDPYRLVRAAFAVGADYIDLADGADFVSGISALDGEAKALGRFALSGMSSFPVLTAAVVRALSQEVPEIDAIEAGIAPSPFAGVGLNVIKAIASYAGKPVEVLTKGGWETRAGFVDSRVMVVNVPGTVPLNPIRFALAEVPDLKVLPGDWLGLREMWMGAGPTPAILHRMLWLAGWLVKIRVLPSLVPFAPVMNWVINTIRWGEHRGGMIVAVRDRAGREVSWHLLAEGDGGPMIPSMAAEAVVRRLLAGAQVMPGARSGHRDLSLADYTPLLARWGIRTGIRRPGSGGLYADLMGEAFGRLAPALRAFHGKDSPELWQGRAEVTRGPGALAPLAARLFGFPEAAGDVPVRVTVRRSANGESWTRDFGGRVFTSHHTRGSGRFAGLAVERFGPFRFGLAVVEQEGKLGLVVRRWSVFGLSLPKLLMPWSNAWEEEAGGLFRFDVDIRLPGVGQVVRYRGWLKPVDAA
jgi:hypothetical protein